MKFKLSKDLLLCKFPSCCSNLITCPIFPQKMLVGTWAGDLSGLVFTWKKRKAESSGTAVIHRARHIQSSFAEPRPGDLSLPRWAGGLGARGDQRTGDGGDDCASCRNPLCQ